MMLLPSSTFKSQNEKSCRVHYVFFTNTLCYMEFFMVTVSWKKINLNFDPLRGATSCFLAGVFCCFSLFVSFLPLKLKRTEIFSANTFQQNWPINYKISGFLVCQKVWTSSFGNLVIFQVFGKLSVLKMLLGISRELFVTTNRLSRILSRQQIITEKFASKSS